MQPPIKPKPFFGRSIYPLPEQYEEVPERLVIVRRIQSTEINDMLVFADQYSYFQLDVYDGSIILGNEIKPAYKVERPSYIKVQQLNEEITQDNEAGMKKYEDAMAKYRKYVERYRNWLSEQKTSMGD